MKFDDYQFTPVDARVSHDEYNRQVSSVCLNQRMPIRSMTCLKLFFSELARVQ